MLNKIKNFYGLVFIIFLTAIIYPQDRIGKHTFAEWRYLIDSTWGVGISTEAKLQIFDTFWNAIDQRYAGFNGIEDKWQQLKSYRDTIALGVSRGRFQGILDHLVKSLQDGHVYMWDAGIASTQLKAGMPLFFPAANTYPTYSWNFGQHFGAALAPLSDSTIFVYKAVSNHPLGLVPGDIILGYDGRKWKELYKDLMEIQFPVPHHYISACAERAATHQWLQAAGMNWHLFDTIDIVKYATGDTVHLSTDLLSTPMPGFRVTEQLPVDGVTFPGGGQDLVSWGHIKGTKIGYIYVWGWTYESTTEDFLQAVNALMPDSSSDALIIDIRFNEGRRGGDLLPGFQRLFNQDMEPLRWLTRTNSSNHFEMQDAGSFRLTLTGTDKQLYDRPIAVLSGPAAMSGGDGAIYVLGLHTMARAFGLPSNGSFGSYNTISGFPSNWITGICELACYIPPDMNNILLHKSIPVDEEVWFTRDGAANGEDDVVKKAVEWINNLVYGHNITLNKAYCNSGDTLKISAEIENPNSHQVTSKVYIENLQGSFVDSLDLIKIGMSGNSEIWTGNYLVPDEEDIYRISLSATDFAESKTWITKNISRFTTTGPVVLDNVDNVYNPASKEYRIELSVQNLSSTDTISEASVKLFCNDSWVISVTPEVRTLPNIHPGSIVQTSSYFAIKIDTTIFPGYFNLQIEALSDGWTFWQDSTKAIVTGIDDKEITHLSFGLDQNYPNPFNPATVISYRLPVVNKVTLKIYDVLGNEVAVLVNEDKPAGNYEVTWNAEDLSSGVYFYQLKATPGGGQARNFTETKKLILMK